MPEARDHPDIQVEFIDAATGGTLVSGRFPAGDLPDTFARPVRLQLEEEAWDVVSADPVTAAEFRARGTLRLTVRRADVRMVDPKDILFSLPSIDDRAPAVAPGTSKAGKSVFELHEDDWRLVEFVAVRHQPAITQCLAAVRRVHEQERAGMGFRNIHVRREVPTPLEGERVTVAEVTAVVPGSRSLDGIAYREQDGLIAGGFAAELPSSVRLFGLEHGGSVAVLGIGPGPRPGPSDAEARALANFAANHALCLIDWCQVAQVPADPDRFVRYFRGS